MKITSALLACAILLVLACSSELPATESSQPATPAAARTQQPTDTPHVAPMATTDLLSASPAPTKAATAPPEPTGDRVPPTAQSRATPASPVQPQPTDVQAAAPTSPPTVATPEATAVTTIVLMVEVAEIPAELPDYDRGDWGDWIDADGDCQDTRNEVLLAESLSDVTFRSGRRCRVDTGQWFAPYSGNTVTIARDLDIDHMVPLANAHKSGGWHWPSERKQLYANYLAVHGHLIAVTASANRSKGAKGPDEWQPADRSYWCQYATDWALIKNEWDLTVTRDEAAALGEMLDTCPHPPINSPRSSGRKSPTLPPSILQHRSPHQRYRQQPLHTRRCASTLPVMPLWRPAKLGYVAQKDLAKVSPSQWYRALETATAMASYANNEKTRMDRPYGQHTPAAVHGLPVPQSPRYCLHRHPQAHRYRRAGALPSEQARSVRPAGRPVQRLPVGLRVPQSHR